MKKIGISFKDTEGDQKILDFLKKQLSPSIYIKTLLKEKMEQEEAQNK